MKSEFVVLCEDKAQADFVRKFLKERGYTKPHQVTIRPLPGRKNGAGEKYVRDQFPNELKAVRSRQGKILIAMIDADTGTVENRKRQLDNACDTERVPRRDASDPVIVAVPRRNIETWFLYLSGDDWSEESDRKAEDAIKKDDRAKSCAKTLHEMCYTAQKLRLPAPPSLEDCCSQWKQL